MSKDLHRIVDVFQLVRLVVSMRFLIDIYGQINQFQELFVLFS